MQPPDFRAQRVASVGQAHHDMRMLERCQQAKHTAGRDSRHCSDLAERGRRVLRAKGREDGQRPVQGRNTTFCRVEVGQRGDGRSSGHQVGR